MKNCVAVISALQEEIEGLKDRLTEHTSQTMAGMEIHFGRLEGQPTAAVISGVGKVNAALCTQLVIDCFAPCAVINPGAAGAIDPTIEVGDIVVSSAACYHDFDTTALGTPPGFIYGMQTSCFPADHSLQLLAAHHARERVGENRTHVGLVVTGDQFIAEAAQRQRIFDTFGASCTEMEGAAIAHVCWKNRIPFVIIRAVSDKADAKATESFGAFLARAIPDLDHITEQTVVGWTDSKQVDRA